MAVPQPTGTKLVTVFTRGPQGVPGDVTPEFEALRDEVVDSAALTIATLKAVGILDADGNPNTLMDEFGNVLTIE